jgi:hypothetical protein
MDAFVSGCVEESLDVGAAREIHPQEVAAFRGHEPGLGKQF